MATERRRASVAFSLSSPRSENRTISTETLQCIQLTLGSVINASVQVDDKGEAHEDGAETESPFESVLSDENRVFDDVVHATSKDSSDDWGDEPGDDDLDDLVPLYSDVSTNVEGSGNGGPDDGMGCRDRNLVARREDHEGGNSGERSCLGKHKVNGSVLGTLDGNGSRHDVRGLPSANKCRISTVIHRVVLVRRLVILGIHVENIELDDSCSQRFDHFVTWNSID